MSVKVELVSLSKLDLYAKRLIPLIKRARIVAFMGPLGAGKTTLIRAVARHMGVTRPLVSPTFTYLAIYNLPNRQQLYHFDLYRLTSITQFYDAGFNEYLEQPNSIVFIEWPELIRAVLPPTTMLVSLEYHATDPDQRLIKVVLSKSALQSH